MGKKGELNIKVLDEKDAFFWLYLILGLVVFVIFVYLFLDLTGNFDIVVKFVKNTLLGELIAWGAFAIVVFLIFYWLKVIIQEKIRLKGVNIRQ